MGMKRKTDVLVVQYPRGRTAIVWFDPVAGSITASHASLRATLRRGVQSWDGCLVLPCDGYVFLAAVYDYLFLNGYAVQWMKVKADLEVWNSSVSNTKQIDVVSFAACRGRSNRFTIALYPFKGDDGAHITIRDLAAATIVDAAERLKRMRSA